MAVLKPGVTTADSYADQFMASDLEKAAEQARGRPQRQPAVALREARERKFREWFEGRRWRIADEMSGERPVTIQGMTTTMTFSAGQFTVPAPGKFHTPLGHAGRTGFLIIEIDAQGQDITGDDGYPVTATFGATALAKAQEVYGQIVGLDSE